MERGISVMPRCPMRVCALLGAALLVVSVRPARAADRLVLILSTHSRVNIVSALDVQKAFLGLTVVVEGTKLRPLRNESDDSTHDIFFQDVISMSEDAYERRLLTLTLQSGRTAP